MLSRMKEIVIGKIYTCVILVHVQLLQVCSLVLEHISSLVVFSSGFWSKLLIIFSHLWSINWK